MFHPVDSSPLKAVRLPTTAPPGRAVLRKTALAVSSGNAGMGSIRVFIVLYGCDCAHARLFFRAIYGRQFRSRSIFWRWSEGLWFRRNRKVSGFNGNRRKPCRRFREKDSFCGEFWVRCFVTIYQVFFPDNSQMLDCHLFDDIRTGNQYQVAGTSTPAKQFPIMQRSIKSPGWISVQVPEEPVSILSFYIKGNIGLW